MELEFDKYCKIDWSPSKQNSTSTNNDCEFLWSEEGGFSDIKLSEKSEDVEYGGRKKIEFSVGDQSGFSFRILDSICGSSDEKEYEDEVKPNDALRKSLLHEFSSAMPNVVDIESVAPACSAVHLKGYLKMERKRGVPCFEFSMAHSEDVFVAKTWKAEDALNWVYTFHSIRGAKKKKKKYSNCKDFAMVGQMQVSCYLCSELIRGHHGGFSSSMVTEFVLYDIAHAGNVENSKVSGDPNGGNVELDDLFALSKPKLRKNSRASMSHPWAPSDLHPNHEIAAVVVQVPFEKRESLKHIRGDKLGNHHLDDPGLLEEKFKVKVNVLTPLGSHGLPSTSSDERRGGPSPLIDRWRVGGGCDCGGWDMACPLVVFANSNTQCMEEHSLLEHHQPLKLYVQGKKDSMPALTITIRNKGQYTVDFHAQLSALQAFAICVAILHTTEASSSAEQDKNIQLLQCSSLKVFVEDEVKVVVEAVTAKEKGKVTKRREESNPNSFVVKPPFSPFARV